LIRSCYHLYNYYIGKIGAEIRKRRKFLCIGDFARLIGKKGTKKGKKAPGAVKIRSGGFGTGGVPWEKMGRGITPGF
jgi:hypothetical protein